MIQIMVYHRDPAQLKKLSALIVAYFQKIRHSYELLACTRWEEAAKHLRECGEKDDIVFLDCSQLQQAAMLAKYLREQNMSTSWVYMGEDLKGLCRVLLLRPSAYLPDLNNSRIVLSVLRSLESYHWELQKKKEFSFKFEGEYIRVPYTDISYFESSAKKVTLHFANSSRTYCFSAKLDDIEQKLPEFFLRCHQSYLVNMHLIRRIDSQNHSFLLHSNEEILISRRNYTTAREAYQSFLDGQQNMGGTF